jgi:hypothetical protein
MTTVTTVTHFASYSPFARVWGLIIQTPSWSSRPSCTDPTTQMPRTVLSGMETETTATWQSYSRKVGQHDQ